MDNKKLNTFMLMVKDMREKQKRYFKLGRRHSDLIASIEAETSVDKFIFDNLRP